MARDWTEQEVAVVVADYFGMLMAELRGESYNKSEHRRAVLPRLDGRTNGSVERKHQNISAVLIGLGVPYIPGYKPLSNYQALLGDEVQRYLEVHPEVLDSVRADIEQEARLPSVADYLSALVDAPRVDEFAPGVILDPPAASWAAARKQTDYLGQERMNRSLGLAGEKFVLEFERQRLSRVGDGALADRVEHVSQSQGDGVGFDVRSFDRSGADLFIEVKTTRYGRHTPFYISSNELAFSQERRDCYGLYRVFEFRTKPKLFVLPGAVDEQCQLRPQIYRAWPPQTV